MKQIYTVFFLSLLYFLQPTASFAQESGSVYGNFPYSQTFLSNVRPTEVTKANVSTGTNAASFTTSGLQLTDAKNLQFGAVFINDRKFNSVNGIIIEFEYMVYGGNGADGFSVFFFNDTVQVPKIGANGAAIGYSYRRAILQTHASNRQKGLSGAYLGIAFDSYGNFKETRYQDEEIIDGIGPGKSARSHVTIRGARGLSYPLEGMEEGFTGYPVLATQSTLSNTGSDHEYVILENNGEYSFYSSNPSYTGNFALRGGNIFVNESSPDYRKAIIELYPIGNDAGMYITVKIQHGQTITTVIDDYEYKSITKYRERAIVSTVSGDRPVWGNSGGFPSEPSALLNLPSAVPGFLRIGFAASTGLYNDIHVIKNLTITLPGAAIANNDTVRTGIGIPAVLYPFGNDMAFQGVISRDQVGDSSYINPASFKIIPNDGSTPAGNYEYQAPEGTWLFDTLTRTMTFTPVPGFIGEASVQYSIKGGLPGHTEPYDDEAYRSLPATITVLVNPRIVAIPSSVLCGDNGVIRLELDSGVISLSSDIQWYKDGVLIPDAAGQVVCIATGPGSYTAQVVISGNTYPSNSIEITKDDDKTIDQPNIYSVENITNLCGPESVIEIRIQEDDLRPDQQTYLWFKDGIPLYDETSYEILVRVPGIYKVLVTEEDCAAFSNELEVDQGENTDFKTPVIAIDPPSEKLCNENGSILLYVSNYAEYGDSAIYKWYQEERLVQSGNSIFFFTKEEGLYTVRVIAGNCSAVSSPIQIFVSPGDLIDDAVIRSVSRDTTLCGDDGVVILQLSRGEYSAEATYAWFKDGTLFSTHPDYQKATIYINEAGRYFLRVIDGDCSVISNEIEITTSSSESLPEPDFKRSPATGQICADQGSVYLYINNSSAYQDAVYTWMLDDTVVKTSFESWFEATFPGSYIVVISSNGCSISTDVITLEGSGSLVNQPEIEATIGNDTICDGAGLTILTLKNPNDFSGITGYQWFKNGLPVQGATHIIYIADTEGLYRLQIMQANCSSISEEYEVLLDDGSTIADIPQLVFDPDLSICTDGVTQLKVSNANLFPGATYLWYRDNILIYTGSDFTYYTDLPGTYFVQVYYDGCSSVSAESTINSSGSLITKPDIVVEPFSATICGPNGSVIIRLSNFASYYTPLTFQWYKNDEIIPGENATIIVIDSAMGAGSYRLRIQNGYGCVTYSDGTDVEYLDNSSIIRPEITPESATIYPDSPPLDQVTITVTNVDPAVTEYLWHDEFQLLRRDVNTGTISYTTSREGKFFVVALYAEDCSAASNISEITSSENYAPQPRINIFPASQEICDGDGVGVIEITNLSEYTDPTFAWMKAGQPDSLVGTGESLVTDLPGTYYVIVTDHENPAEPLESIPSNRVDFIQGTNSIQQPVIISSGNKICGINGRVILYPENHTAYYSADAIYRWLLNDIEVQYGNNPSYIASQAGSYILQVFDGDCFAESSPKTIDYEDGNYPVPDVRILGGDELQVCGDNATLILHIFNEELFTDATLQWFRNEIPLPGETGLFLRVDSSNNNLGGNDYYHVQASFGDCSTLSNKKEVRIYSSDVTKPVLERIPAGGELCGEDASILLRITNTADLPGQIYYWFRDSTQIVQQGNNPAYEVTEAGTYTVYVTGTPCSSESDPETVLLISGSDITKPVIDTAGGDLCTGNSEWLLLMTTHESNYTSPVYQWYNGNTIIPGMTKPRLTVNTAGTYRLQVIDGNCSAFSEFITVPSGSGNYTYKPAISAVGDHAICGTGGNTLLQVNDSALFLGSTFNWYYENTLMQSGTSYYYYAEAPGSYYVHIINLSGCSSVSSELEIEHSDNEIERPVLVSLPDTPSLCGEDGQLIIDLSNPDHFTGYDYQWYRNNIPVINESGIVAGELSLIVSSAGSYRLRLINGDCITFSDSLNITVDPNQNIEQPQLGMYPSNGQLCMGSNSVIIFVENEDRYASGTLYTWYRDTTKISEDIDVYTLEADTAGHYHVRVLDGSCLAISSPISLASSNDSIPEPRIISSSDGQVICGSDASVVLTLENLSDYSSRATFQWFNGNNTIIIGETDPAIEVKNPGIYRIQVYDGDCSALSEEKEITRDDNSTIEIPTLSKLPSDAELCEEYSNFLLYVNNHNDYINPTYNWFRDQTMIEGVHDYILRVSDSGSYFVQVVEGECSATSEHLDITSHSSGNNIKNPLIIGNSDNINTVCGKDGVVLLQLKDTSGFSGVTFYWYKGIDLIPDENTTVLIVKDSGTYRLMAELGECVSFSNEIKIGLNLLDEIDEPVLSMQPETGSLCGENGTVFFRVTNEEDYTIPRYGWFQNNILLENSSDPVYETNRPGDYFVQVVDAETGCMAISTIETVTDQGTIEEPVILSTSGDTGICATDGSILLLLENEIEFPGAILQWYNGKDTLNGDSLSLYNATVNGEYRLLVFYNGCYAFSNTVSVYMKSGEDIVAPELVLSPANGIICGNGSSVTISVSNTGEYNNPSYNWFKDNSLIRGENDSTLTVNLPGKYFVQVVTDSCSAVSDTLAVYTGNKPEFTFGNDSACTPDSVNLASLILTSGSIDGLTLNYLDKDYTELPSTFVHTSDTFYITGTNTQGCSDTSMVIITIHPQPTFGFIKTDTTVCFGNSVELRSMLNIEPVDTVLFFTDRTGTVPLISSLVMPLDDSIFYFIIENKTTGCRSFTDSLLIYISPMQTCAIIGPDSLCPGEIVTYTAPSGMTGYSWSISGAGSIVSDGDIQTITISADNKCNDHITLSLNITDPNGCSSACTGSIEIAPSQPVKVSGPADTTVYSCDFTDQTTLQEEFDKWKSRFIILNPGCNAVDNFAATYNAPDICTGDSVVVTYYASDLCGSDTISRVFRIIIPDSVSVNVPNDTLSDICAYASQSELNVAFNTWKAQFGITEDGCGVTPPDLSSYNILYSKCTDTSVSIIYSINDGCTQASANRTFTVKRDSISPSISGIIQPDTICTNESLPLPVIDIPELEAMGIIISDQCFTTDQLALSHYDIPNTTVNPQYYTRYYIISDPCGNKDSLEHIIYILPLPVSFDISASNYCENEAGGTISLSSSQSGIFYQLMQEDTPFSTVRIGTGSPLNWDSIPENTGYFINMYYPDRPYCSTDSDTVEIRKLNSPYVSIPQDSVYVLGNTIINIPVTHSANDGMRVFYSVIHNSVIQNRTLEIPNGSPTPFQWQYTSPGINGIYYIRLDSVVSNSGCKALLDSVYIIHVYGDCKSDDFHISCPNDTSFIIPYGSCYYTADSIGYPVIINMPGNNLDTIIYEGPGNFIFSRGVHEIRWIAVDACGKRDTCTQIVIANYKPCGDNDTVYYLEEGVVMDSIQKLEAVDYEQNIYPTVRIGCNCWTAKNLVSTKYSDGQDIENHYIYYSDLYPDTNINLTKYGRLYTGFSAIDPGFSIRRAPVQGICPNGWIVPTVEQYSSLIPYGSDALREPNEWLYDENATNITGFGALPAGYYNANVNTYYYLLGDAYFWTSDRASESVGKVCHIRYLCPEIMIIDFKMHDGASIRCVKAEE